MKRFLFLHFRACERIPESPVQSMDAVTRMESVWSSLSEEARDGALTEAFRSGGMNTPVTRFLSSRFLCAWIRPSVYIQSTHAWVGWALCLNFPLFLLLLLRPSSGGVLDAAITLGLCVPALLLNLWLGKVLKRMAERRAAGLRCLGPLAPMGLYYLLALADELAERNAAADE